jgi:hypothetical protein
VIREVLRKTNSHLWWVDKHFHRQGLELLNDEAENLAIADLRILSGPANIDDAARRDFRLFRKEMLKRNIACDWRVHELHELHDRYVLTGHACYNVPPVRTIFQGGWSDVTLTNTRPPFDKWWEQATPILG